MSNSTLHVFTDGGSRGNPGKAAIGVFMELGGECLLRHSEYIGTATNNVAEYKALIASFDHLPQILGSYAISSIDWKLDSLLVVEQVNKRWKIKDNNLLQLAQIVWRQLAQVSLPYTIAHVGREHNGEADTLVNYALDNTT